jgi:hypothetical protein
MTRPRLVWAALIGIPTALELWAAITGRDEWTLSPHLRAATRSGTPWGNACVIALTGAGSTWLAHHLVTIPPAD